MKSLMTLALNGDSSSPKNLRLPSLKPFSGLENLKQLDLKLTTVIDKSYDVLLDLPNLEQFDTLTHIPMILREKIKQHPKLNAGFF